MDIFTIATIFFLILVAFLLFYFGYRFFSDFFATKRRSTSTRTPQRKGTPKTPCPLCNSMLYDGENLITRVYKTSTIQDQPCTIHGCPHCYPQLEEGVKRTCPVCHKGVPLKGHLDARIFTRGSAKKHVHITGCTECHKKR